MKDKHLHIEKDTELLRNIYRQVEACLSINKTNFRVLLLVKLIFYLSLSLTAYLFLFQLNDPTLFLLCFVFYGGITLLFAFNFAHDFSHGTVFKNSLWDNLGFIAIYTLNGAHAESWKKRHIESHHFAPNVEQYDSDLEISSLIRVIPESKYQWFHKFQHLYAPIAYTTYSLYWVFIKDFYIHFKGNKQNNIQYSLSFWFQKVFYISYLLVLPMLFAEVAWYIVLSGFSIMHLVQSLFLLFTFFMTHHIEGLEYPTIDAQKNINTSWAMNQIRSSNDMHPFSQTANFIFGGFNNHIAHHLFPHVHHIHYPKLNKILYKMLIDNGIMPSQTTYWGGVMSHLRHLKNMSRPMVL